MSKSTGDRIQIEQSELSNSRSTGGAGYFFENQVQSSFVALMLSKGRIPCFPNGVIKEIRLQRRVEEYNTDDAIIFLEDVDSGERYKLLVQIKQSISITKGNKSFGKAIGGAWLDYRNSKFTQGSDMIAIITNSLSSLDQRTVQFLLNQAKCNNDHNEYFRNIQKAKFAPSKCIEKLEAIKHHLKRRNNNEDVQEVEVFNFFKSLHIFEYDLGWETGVVLSLLQSHISQYSQKDANAIWLEISNYVATRNWNAGIITIDNISKTITKKFEVHKQDEIPKSFRTPPQKKVEKTKWFEHTRGRELALLSLIGTWSEQNENELNEIYKFINTSENKWLKVVSEIQNNSDTPLKLNSGYMSVSDRVRILTEIRKKIYTKDICKFLDLAAKILGENEREILLPYTNLIVEDNNHIEKFSEPFRQGIAEGIAIISNNLKIFQNCNLIKIEKLIEDTVRKLLENASWLQWSALDKFLPDLAEAKPREFLGQLKYIISQMKNPIKEKYENEKKYAMRGYFNRGIFRALEVIAWDKDNFVKSCLCLVELANIIQSENWKNTVLNSLIHVLLPWSPQTMANVEKRIVALDNIVKKDDELGWELAIKLLPDQVVLSSGTYKPRWRIDDFDQEKVKAKYEEYWKQVDHCANLLVEKSKTDMKRLVRLVKLLDKLPINAREKFLNNLKTNEYSKLSEDNKKIIWENLTKIILKHKKFPDADWTLPNKQIIQIEAVAKKFAPSDPVTYYQHLFSSKNYEFHDSDEELDNQRVIAIKKLLKYGIDYVLEFNQNVEMSYLVGKALASIEDKRIDAKLIPVNLVTVDTKLNSLIRAFVSERQRRKNWEWVRKISMTSWTKEQIINFFSYLPFERENWECALSFSGIDEIEYWKKICPNTLWSKPDGLEFGVEYFLKYKRPIFAVQCLVRMLQKGQSIDSKLCTSALLAGTNSTEEIVEVDEYWVLKLIQKLQTDCKVDRNKLVKIELAYLQYMIEKNVKPKTLREELIINPEFFCKILKIIYRSSHEVEQKRTKISNSEMYGSAFYLLYNMETLPGTKSDGAINFNILNKWIEQVREICEKSGHLEMANHTIGRLLSSALKENDALWSQKDFVKILNDEGVDDLHEGFIAGITEERDARPVDSTGIVELEKAELFLERADKIENEGYHIFAETLRTVSECYKLDAERRRYYG